MRQPLIFNAMRTERKKRERERARERETTETAEATMIETIWVDDEEINRRAPSQ
jgi:hypothetical protein